MDSGTDSDSDSCSGIRVRVCAMWTCSVQYIVSIRFGIWIQVRQCKSTQRLIIKTHPFWTIFFSTEDSVLSWVKRFGKDSVKLCNVLLIVTSLFHVTQVLMKTISFEWEHRNWGQSGFFIRHNEPWTGSLSVNLTTFFFSEEKFDIEEFTFFRIGKTSEKYPFTTIAGQSNFCAIYTR